MKTQHQPHGFTLVELMIVVAIVALLSTIAYPAYQDQVHKTRRADAKVALLDNAQQFERCYTQFSNYTNAICPTGFPINSAKGYYSINLVTSSLTASTYTLIATPLGSQLNDLKCTSLSLAHTGNRTATGTTPTKCW